MIPAKTPKTCVAQFCKMRDPQAYEDMEFYKTTITRAREELLKMTPFSSLQSLRGTWVPEKKFVKPSYKYANSESTCAYFHTYPSEHDIQFMMEPFLFGTTQNEQHYKFFVIFDCELSTKIQLQRIKLENTELPTIDAHTDGPFTAMARYLLDNADKDINIMSTDIQKAKCDWFDALVTYCDSKEAFVNKGMAAVQPQPYRQALPDEQHIPVPRLTIIEPGKPNLQIQIKPGNREVFHAPDTTGTPQPIIIMDDTFPMNNIVHSVSPNYPPQGLPQTPQHTQPQNPVQLTPHMFFNMCMQQQQQQQQQPQLLIQQQEQPQLQIQQQQQPQQIQLIQQQQLPMHQ